MATPISNYQPYVAMTQAVSLFGIFPSQALGGEYISTLLTFAGNFAPNGYQSANGGLIPIAENDALFALIGTTYGGDGQTTFGLPNLAGLTTVGIGQGPGLSNYQLGEVAGSTNINLPLNTLPTTLGGSSQPVSNLEPTMAVTYGIALQGIFPSRNFTPGTEASSAEPFLGEIAPFLTNFVPRGWAQCNGQLLSIAQNQALFAILGTTYGGNGQTTFALPDLRGRTPVGVGGELGLQLGESIGNETTTIAANQAPDALTGAAGAPISNMQPSLALNYIIALQGVFPPRAFSPDTASGQDPAIAEVQLFAGNFAPRGWAICDGQLLSISQNTALFSLLGTQYGGNGTTTFALPDLRGKSILGAGTSPFGTFNVGDTGGSAFETLTADELPNVAPVITSDGGQATATLNKIDPTGTLTTIAGHDINIPAQTLTFSITGGEDSLLFNLDANRNLTFVSPPDVNAVNGLPNPGATPGYQVTVQASDGAGGLKTQAITVHVSPNIHITGNSVSYSDAIGGVYVDLPTQKGYRAGGLGSYIGGPLSVTPIATDSFAGIANVEGGAFDDLLVGDNVANILIGNGGNDVLFGQGGDDTLSGGGVSAPGANQLWGGADNDTASYASETLNVTADLTGLYGYVGGVAASNLRDTYNSIENLLGGLGDDNLRGDLNANVLTGGVGNDVLMGFAGNDTLVGGASSGGNYNQLWGGDDSDTASYTAETTVVTADLVGGWAYVGGVAAANLRDTYNSIENLTGGSANDVLSGDANANIIRGGVGADQLYGRGGADTFVYGAFAESNVPGGYDTIADFVTGVDKIDLRAYGTDASHVIISSDATSTKLLVQVNPASFNSATDLAVSLIGPNALVIGDILL